MALSAAERTKKWRESEKGIKKRKEWREKNKENIASYNKQWREDNLEHCKDVSKAYREHPEVKKANQKRVAKYRATEKGQKTGKAYYERNKEKLWANSRRWAKDHPEREAKRLRESHLKRHYGITQEDYENMMEEQEGKCAICDELPTTYHGLVIDHDHCIIEPNVRGLICQPCNVGLARFKEDPDILQRAITYLQR